MYCHGPLIQTGPLSWTVMPSHSPILVSLGLSSTVSMVLYELVSAWVSFLCG
jgi:hypothetical protein